MARPCPSSAQFEFENVPPAGELEKFRGTELEERLAQTFIFSALLVLLMAVAQAAQRCGATATGCESTEITNYLVIWREKRVVRTRKIEKNRRKSRKM